MNTTNKVEMASTKTNYSLRWASAHPIKWGILVGLMVLFSAIAAATSLWLICLFGCGIVLAIYGVAASRHKATVLMLCAALATADAKAQEKESATGVGVGLAILVAAGVGTFFLVKYCQKHFPRTPSNETNQLWAASSDPYAAALLAYPTSCYSPAVEDPKPIFRLTAIVREDGVEITSFRCDQVAQSSNAEEFVSDLIDWGLVIPTTGGFHRAYGAGGIPCSEDQVPIQIIDSIVPTAIITAPGPCREVTVEVSTDLLSWTPVLEAQIPVGMKIEVADLPGSQMAFYRVRSEP